MTIDWLFAFFFFHHRISLNSSSVVLSEPSVPKTEDIDLTTNSDNLTNGSQTVLPVVIQSVPDNSIVDELSNMSLSSVNLKPKVFIVIFILFLEIFNNNIKFLLFLGSGHCYEFEFYIKSYRKDCNASEIWHANYYAQTQWYIC